jgi:uncharacterized Zn-finger protein
MICVECLNNVSLACEMKRKCIEADQKLRQTLETELNAAESDTAIQNTIIHYESFATSNEMSNDLEGDYSQQANVVFEIDDTKNVETEKDTDKSIEKDDSEQRRKSLRLCSTRKRKLESSLLAKDEQSERLKMLKYDNSLKIEADSKDFHCDMCKFSSKRKKNVERHILAVHMKSFKIICSFKNCNRQYTTQAALKLHCVRDHDESSPFVCEKCYQKFSCESLFKIHHQRLTCRPRKKTNLKKVFEKTLNCPHCEFMTAHQFSLAQHVNLIHLNIRKTWKCSICEDTKFTNRTSLNQHMFVVHNLSHIRCPDCDQAFRDQSQLKSHKESLKCNARKATEDDFEETSAGVKCNLCNRFYRSKKEWITHYFNHHKFNKVCDICNLQLSTYASLKNHKKTIHEKIKRFSCSECPKSFSAKHTLKFHLNIHSGLKPYTCKFCSFKASDRSSISKHQKKLHAGL